MLAYELVGETDRRVGTRPPFRNAGSRAHQRELIELMKMCDPEAMQEVPELGRGVRVYTGPVLANLAIIRDVLESYGIACETRREYLGGAAGELPPIETWPELWVFDESRVEQARQLVQEALEPPTASTSWTCPQCREDVESQFSECWSCGAERPEGAGS